MCVCVCVCVLCVYEKLIRILHTFLKRSINIIMERCNN